MQLLHAIMNKSLSQMQIKYWSPLKFYASDSVLNNFLGALCIQCKNNWEAKPFNTRKKNVSFVKLIELFTTKQGRFGQPETGQFSDWRTPLADSPK